MEVEKTPEKKSFVLYIDHKELWENLSNEQAGKLIRHIYSYVVGEDAKPPDEMTKLLFYQIKATLDRDQKKWEEVRKSRSENGKKGGRPSKAKKANGFEEKQTKAKKAVSVNVNDTATVNVNDSADEELNDLDILQQKYLANEDLVTAAKRKFHFNGQSDLKKRLTEFNLFLKAKDQNEKSWRDYVSHFMFWHEKSKKLNKSNGPTFNSPVI